MTKKILLLALFSLLFSFTLFAVEKSKTYEAKSYDEAIAAADQITFKIWSVKAGLFRSEVKGVVKRFEAISNWSQESKSLPGGKIIFEVASLDTDNGMRNSKMHDLCLDIKKSPTIVVELTSGPLALGEHKQVPALMTVRSKSFPITLDLTIAQENELLIVKGLSNLGFKQLEIPDPSIVIAKVEDKIQIEFAFKH